eukprot:TRINITY_DN6817_c0_g1_i1.p1 TRINITY_DN6817_c0_g1~~TRINITY_DN6817_c0_g1_i1.p1  ORF type:complete len:230 (+),score=53.80 TRINITY_DN6817_c0_g1_i1:300-989(+)
MLCRVKGMTMLHTVRLNDKPLFKKRRMSQKPFSDACERNKEPILNVLRNVFQDRKCVLEIGSGTGQHCVHFAPNLPHLIWQPSDQASYMPGLLQWVGECDADNLRDPIELDVSKREQWPDPSDELPFDAVFTANTVHFMAWDFLPLFFKGVSDLLPNDGKFLVYGPFNYNGEFTSEGNVRLDKWLKENDPLRGIRDFEAVVEVARENGLDLVEDFEMPANNRTLFFKKQ